jgi:hypothetical protein
VQIAKRPVGVASENAKENQGLGHLQEQKSSALAQTWPEARTKTVRIPEGEKADEWRWPMAAVGAVPAVLANEAETSAAGDIARGG